MTIADLDTARRIVDRYAMSSAPLRGARPGQVWGLSLARCTFRTAGGREIITSLSASCWMPDQEGVPAKERERVTRQETANGRDRLAHLLLEMFGRKRGVAGYRGWFTFTELVSVWDQKRREVVPLTSKRSGGARSAPERRP